MPQMEYTTIEDLENQILGKVGTPRRDAFEVAVKEDIQAYHIGETIKEARKKKNITQEELGNLMGVKRSMVSRIENGNTFNLSAVTRAFKALGLHINLEIEGGVKLALW